MLDAVSSMRSLSVLLSAVEMTCTTQNSPSTSVVTIRNHSHTCAPAVFTSHGYYSRVMFISYRASDCVAIIQGRCLFEGSDYLRPASIRRNMVHVPDQQAQFSSLFTVGTAPFLCLKMGPQPLIFSDFEKMVSFLETQVHCRG